MSLTQLELEMRPTQQELGIDKLSLEDRRELVHEILDRVEEEEPISDEVKAMLEERIAELDADPESSISWEEIQAEMMERFRK